MNELLEKLAIELGKAAVSAIGAAYATNSKDEMARIEREATGIMKWFLYLHHPFYNPTDNEILIYRENYKSAVNGLGADIHAAIREVLNSNCAVEIKGLLGIVAGGMS